MLIVHTVELYTKKIEIQILAPSYTNLVTACTLFVTQIFQTKTDNQI